MRTVKLDHETPRFGVKIKNWNHHLDILFAVSSPPVDASESSLHPTAASPQAALANRHRQVWMRGSGEKKHGDLQVFVDEIMKILLFVYSVYKIVNIYICSLHIEWYMSYHNMSSSQDLWLNERNVWSKDRYSKVEERGADVTHDYAPYDTIFILFLPDVQAQNKKLHQRLGLIPHLEKANAILVIL